MAIKKKANYTPGPWNAQEEKHYFKYPDGEIEGIKRVFRIGVPEKTRPGALYTIDRKIAPTYEMICEISDKRVGDQEAAANAHLISAAPDLLAALKDAADFIAAINGHRGGDIVEAADAAIAKAEGR